MGEGVPKSCENAIQYFEFAANEAAWQVQKLNIYHKSDSFGLFSDILSVCMLICIFVFLFHPSFMAFGTWFFLWCEYLCCTERREGTWLVCRTQPLGTGCGGGSGCWGGRQPGRDHY